MRIVFVATQAAQVAADLLLVLFGIINAMDIGCVKDPSEDIKTRAVLQHIFIILFRFIENFVKLPQFSLTYSIQNKCGDSF